MLIATTFCYIVNFPFFDGDVHRQKRENLGKDLNYILNQFWIVLGWSISPAFKHSKLKCISPAFIASYKGSLTQINYPNHVQSGPSFFHSCE